MKINMLFFTIFCTLLLPITCSPAIAQRRTNNEIYSKLSYGFTCVYDLAFNITYTPNAEVLAYIEKMKSDPQVKQIVEEDAANPQSWWRWFDSLPVESVSSINQKEAMEWLENYMTFSKEERKRLSYNLLRLD